MEQKLLELVSRNPLFYDKTCEAYKDIEKKERKWREIDAILKLPANSGKKRWKTLRDRHIRERKKFSSKSPNKKITWKFAKHMKFLDDYLDRYSHGIKPDPMEEETEEFESHDESYTAAATIELPNGETQNIELIRNVESVYTEEYQPENEYTTNVKNENMSIVQFLTSKSAADTSTGGTSNTAHVDPRNRRKRKSDDDNLQKTAHRNMMELINLAKSSFETESPTRAFFNGLARQIEDENLSFERFASLQQRVLNIVHEEIEIHRKDYE